MASPTIIDAQRTTMAKGKKWIQKAVPGSRKEVFKAKAEAVGKTTREYAAEKASAPGELGREARLAETLMGMSHKHAARKSRMYPSMKKD